MRGGSESSAPLVSAELGTLLRSISSAASYDGNGSAAERLAVFTSQLRAARERCVSMLPPNPGSFYYALLGCR